MKHFSQSVLVSNVSTLDPDIVLSGHEFLFHQQSLLIAMDSNPEDTSPSEEGILADFIKWVMAAKDDDREGRYPMHPVFIYANINTGFTQVFVMTDNKGKMRSAVHDFG